MTEASKHAPPIQQIQNFQLEPFEKAVYSRNYEVASQLLLDDLRKLKAGAQFIGYQNTSAMLPVLYTRFCAAVVCLMADPGYKLSQDGFDAFAGEHAIVDQLFRASAFGTSDHLLPQMSADPSEKDASKITFNDPAGLAKFMLTYSLGSGFAMNFEEAFRKNPNATFFLYVGMLTAMISYDKTSHDRRELLLGISDVFEGVVLSDNLMAALSDAYMYCSYADRPDKHRIKKLIHQLYVRLIYAHGFEDAKPKAAKLTKPTVLVPVEWFTSLHAMYRCYAPLIRQLRTRFRVVGAGRPHAIDEVSRQEFDDWIAVPADHVALEQIVEQVKALAPDIVYYPSIGMDLVWVALASVRLAPLQLMSLGHPASSCSPAIDYVICEQGDVGDPALFTETLAELPKGSLFKFVMRVDADLPPPTLKRTDVPGSVVKLAVPAMVLKLNAPFLATLKRIAETAKSPVEFHFWPNMIGTNLYQTSREIRKWLPEAITYERSQYNAYMRQLAECHVQLGTFPFGGTNSNIDCMLLGLPLVAMIGDEPHARFDATMQARVRLPNWLTCHTTEEYIAAAVRLIDGHEERYELSRHLIEDADIQGTFFGDADGTAFLDKVTELYGETSK